MDQGITNSNPVETSEILALPVDDSGDKFAIAMQHNNGNQMVAIDIETTGANPVIHEIIQLAIIPLDAFMDIRRDVKPFYINMKPEYPESADPKIISKERLMDVMQRGFDVETAKDMFMAWVDRLKLPHTKYGRRRQMIPLGHNYTFDKSFIVKWLGMEMYEEFFLSTYRDTMIAALYLNDNRSFHASDVEFRRVSLSELAIKLNIPYPRQHDALADAYCTAQCYKKMCNRGLL